MASRHVQPKAYLIGWLILYVITGQEPESRLPRSIDE